LPVSTPELWFALMGLSKKLSQSSISLRITIGMSIVVDRYNAANSRAVICLDSASEYCGLMTLNPNELSVTVPQNSFAPGIIYPPIKVYFFSSKQYEMRISEVVTNSGAFKIYSEEKTIIDLFRYRRKIGDDNFLESLEIYLVRHKRRTNRLLDCARVCGAQQKFFHTYDQWWNDEAQKKSHKRCSLRKGIIDSSHWH
jgi:hypothetical protein